ncbi:MAG: hypothetical protein M0C28_42235 [Candidatus Moduliflexus flocculans]|nr:hypothetical protein [Candidatus Moduliflexus flocculans]
MSALSCRLGLGPAVRRLPFRARTKADVAGPPPPRSATRSSSCPAIPGEDFRPRRVPPGRRRRRHQQDPRRGHPDQGRGLGRRRAA